MENELSYEDYIKNVTSILTDKFGYGVYSLAVLICKNSSVIETSYDNEVSVNECVNEMMVSDAN